VIEPRFAGRLYDAFPGGCVTYAFDFAAGSQIALTEQFESAVGLYSRQQLRLVEFSGRPRCKRRSGLGFHVARMCAT
jgi:hypothetical protein